LAGRHNIKIVKIRGAVSHEELLELFDSLPPESQRRVLDLMQRLRDMHAAQSRPKENSPGKLIDEPFIGMWRDREDMADSSGWVRGLRTDEWVKPIE
jgi:hypothetical protein